MADTKRVVQIAKELYEDGGRMWSAAKLATFLGVDRDTARSALCDLNPVCGMGTGKRYYYLDVAEVIANGW